MRDFLTKSISFPPALLKVIDKARKDMPRSRYICRTLEEALGIPENRRTKYE